MSAFKDDNERQQAGQLPSDPFQGTRPAGDAASRPWPELIPFDRPVVPAFPTEVLPDWQRRLVEAAALETETAPDLGALAVLSAQATAVQRKMVVEQRPGFMQVLALWTLSLLKSGGRKSRVFSLATAALEAWQIQRAEAMRQLMAEGASAKRRLEQRLRRAEKAAADARNSDERTGLEVEANALASQLGTLDVPRAPVLFVTEATPERLEEMLAEHGERMAVLSDENGMIELLSGRYSRGAPNLSSLNSAHDGGRIRVGRKKRDDGTGGDRMLEHAVISFGLSVQPDRVFSELRDQTAFFDSGFAWRFLYALVPSYLGSRGHRTPTTPAEVQQEYSACMTELLEIPTPVGIDFPVIRPSPEAAEALLAWEAKIQEPKLKDGGELGSLESWGSKLASRLCRIAALFHIAEHRTAPWDLPLDLSTMERALALAPYFTAHVTAVACELHADPNVTFARRALAWMLREGRPTFTKRDLHKAVANNDVSEVLDRPIAILVQRGYIREAPTPKGALGRPSTVFEINPRAMGAG